MASAMALVVAVSACASSESATGPSASAPASGPSTERAASSAAFPPTSVGPGQVGPGELIDSTEAAGLELSLAGVRGHAVAAADVNDDGWTDLFVGTFADRPIADYQVRGADGPAPDRLILGSPSGFVLDESFEGRLGRTAGALFDDLDADGDPDLVVSRNVRGGERQGAPSEIYRNDGGHLRSATVLDSRRGGRAVRAVDFDRDGRRDLVLVEDRWSAGSTALYHNEGELEFRDVTSEVGFPSDVSGLGAGVGDLNNDGIDDLVVGGSNRWFLGDGAGFHEGAGSPLPWSLAGDEDDPANVVLFDADDDGDSDILIGQHFNSTVDDGRSEPVRLFLNSGSDGGPRFTDVTDEVGLPGLGTKSPQVVLLDLDGDGMDDIVTTASHEGGDGRLEPVVLRRDVSSGGAVPRFTALDVTTGPHYWIDAVTLDANGDGRQDVFFVEWEPALGSRLYLNLPAG